MIHYVFLRLSYAIYIVITTLIMYHVLSRLIFHPQERTLKTLFAGVIMALIWPLALFSKNGRRSFRASLPFVNK